MPVIAVRSEPRCKLCSHARRDEIDALLELRSNGKSVDGQRVNLEYVLAKFAEFGVDNPNRDNVTIHWRKHCEKVTEDEFEQRKDVVEKKMDEMFERAMAGGVDVEADLDFLWALGIEQVRERVKNGQPAGITVDHLMKIAAEKGRRGQNEAQAELLKALGASTALAIKGEVKFAGILPGAEPVVEVPQLDEGDIIEGEVVEHES